jgi:phenylalanyl-tRNA synthetase alpha chain
MIQKINALLAEVAQAKAQNAEEVEQFRLKFLGKKGAMNDLFEAFKSVPGPEKKDVGQALNQLKVAAAAKLEEFQQALEETANDQVAYDPFLPPAPYPIGSLHPITIIKNQITDIFERMGFNISEGPEVVDDFHNFEALNFAADHPARDMQDTFFVQTNPDILLRTHTSSVQVKVMREGNLPIRTISPGRVYRNEAISARSHCFFHQIEGLYIDEKASFADLKQTLFKFVQEFFGEGVKIRFRPSFFPFTEPSAEMDIYWGLETEVDHRITKGTGWLEILGCGMVDPQVLENCGIDSKQSCGFAFGLGIERIAMLKYQIGDLRMFSENDLRFLKQFVGETA